MNSKSNSVARRTINIVVGLAIVIMLAAGFVPSTTSVVLSAIGLVAVIVGLIYSFVTAAMRRQSGWLLFLALATVVGAALAVVGVNQADSGVPPVVNVAQLTGIFLAFVAFAYGVMNTHGVLDRGLPAFLGGWGLLTLVIGGTLVGGAIGTNVGAASQNVTALGFHLYAVAGVLAAFAWITGVIVSSRTQAWGWFALVLLLPGIGAFMFGLFGPTYQDVLMARENAARRRAVGLR